MTQPPFRLWWHLNKRIGSRLLSLQPSAIGFQFPTTQTGMGGLTAEGYWLKAHKSLEFLAWVKLLRAYGGCLGTKGR